MTEATLEARFDYEAYLKSDEWASRREFILEWADYRCQVCNSPHDLHVHHRAYERVGHEDPADLTVLCMWCHDLFHMGGRIYSLYGRMDLKGVVV